MPRRLSGRPTSAPITSAQAAAAYLEGLINMERRPDLSYTRMGLEAIEALLERVGNPERRLDVIHVAGSKGKGSTCLFCESILGAAGERVGTFTSPHLERWTERFRIGGHEVEGDRLAQVVEELRPHVDELRRGDPTRAPTFFDATTAAALLLFARAEVDRAVLEVGLGGRLDSTNAVRPAVTCITSIELEHTRWLGHTLEAIAREKAGILKSGVPCVIGKLPGQAEAAVRERAVALGAPLLRLGEDFGVETRRVSRSTPTAGYPEAATLRFWCSDGFELEAALQVPGEHQADNAALALAAVRQLGDYPDPRLSTAAGRGLAAARLPGRVEILEREPSWVIVDSAHTPASALALSRVLTGIAAPRTHLVLSVSADKELSTLLATLLPLAEEVTLTRAEPVRSLDPEDLAEAVCSLRPDLKPQVVPDPHQALLSARRRLGPGELLCATGSVYLAGIARSVLTGLLASGARPRARPWA
jgi:dihydrofolate synthase/folylpolyglutamate synthase